MSFVVLIALFARIAAIPPGGSADLGYHPKLPLLKRIQHTFRKRTSDRYRVGEPAELGAPSFAEQNSGAVHIQLASPLRAAQTGDAVHVQLAAPSRAEQQEDEIPVQLAAPSRAESSGDANRVQFRAEQAGDALNAQLDALPGADQNRYTVHTEIASPLRAEQIGDVIFAQHDASSRAEQNAIHAKLGTPSRVEQNGVSIHVQLASPSGAEQNGDAVIAKLDALSRAEIYGHAFRARLAVPSGGERAAHEFLRRSPISERARVALLSKSPFSARAQATFRAQASAPSRVNQNSNVFRAPVATRFRAEQTDEAATSQEAADDSHDVKVEPDPKSGLTLDVLNRLRTEAPDSGYESESPPSSPDVVVKMEAEKNGFLFFPSSSELSFADPVVDPRVTRELKLEPLEDEPMDSTHGEGFFKIGKFYKLKDTGEAIVIKWFNEEVLPVGEDWRSSEWIDLKTSVETDFHTQSIAHMLSKLYSGRVKKSENVVYVQPLLVESLEEDGIHFGLMERRFEPFHRNPPQWRQNAVQRFLRFHEFLSSKHKFIRLSDAQGWYARGQDLFMTDATMDLPDQRTGDYFIVTPEDGYNLKALYSFLKGKVVMMDFSNQALCFWEVIRGRRESDYGNARSSLDVVSHSLM